MKEIGWAVTLIGMRVRPPQRQPKWGYPMKRRKGRTAKRTRFALYPDNFYEEDFEDFMTAYDMLSYDEVDSDEEEQEEFDLAAWRADLAARSVERDTQRLRDIKRGLYGYDR